jgi:ParB family transcriptional regulator, chromosome partitioning protein
LAGELSGKKTPKSPANPPTDGNGENVGGVGTDNEKVRHDELSPTNTTETQNGSGIKNSVDAKPQKTIVIDNDLDGDQGGQDHGELTSWPKGRAISDPQRMSKPLLLVEYDGRSAAVILNKRPSTPGLLHIRYEDGGGDAEVDAGQCKINLLTDTDK